MELIKEILIKSLEEAELPLSDFVSKVIESKCYMAICKIKNILNDENLSDFECFGRIEKIVNALEEIGTNGGSRHDF